MAEIRSAQENESDRLIEIARATYLGTMAAIVPPEALKAFNAGDEAGEFVRACWQDFDVAIAEGTVVGFLFVHENRIESLHIHPDHARKGFGAALLAHGEDKIASAHSHADLDVLEGNENAHGFYVAHGWRDVHQFEGLEVGNVPAPMILMRKTLTRQN